MNLIKMRKRFERINKRVRSRTAIRSESTGSGGTLSESVLNKCRSNLGSRDERGILSQVDDDSSVE